MIGNDGGRRCDTACIAALCIAAAAIAAVRAAVRIVTVRIGTKKYGISIIDINKSMPIIDSNNR